MSGERCGDAQCGPSPPERKSLPSSVPPLSLLHARPRLAFFPPPKVVFAGSGTGEVLVWDLRAAAGPSAVATTAASGSGGWGLGSSVTRPLLARIVLKDLLDGVPGLADQARAPRRCLIAAALPSSTSRVCMSVSPPSLPLRPRSPAPTLPLPRDISCRDPILLPFFVRLCRDSCSRSPKGRPRPFQRGRLPPPLPARPGPPGLCAPLRLVRRPGPRDASRAIPADALDALDALARILPSPARGSPAPAALERRRRRRRRDRVCGRRRRRRRERRERRERLQAAERQERPLG